MTIMPARKRIALVAHDAMKPAIVAWAKRNRELLSRHELFGTGTTGGKVAEEAGLDVTRLKSGPLGGDQQLGAMIAESRLDVLILITDPLTSMPHDVDVKALTRIATLEQVVMACNAASADFVIASDMIDKEYSPRDDEAAHAR